MRDTAKTPSILVVSLLLAIMPLQAQDNESADDDPWSGKDRAEIVRQLGEPTRVKKPGREGETLIYRFRRVDPADPPAPGVSLVVVPGIGLLARVDAAGTRTEAPMAIEPTRFDRDGRSVPGGALPSRSASTSYHPKTGELERSIEGQDHPPVKGPVKLTFVLDSNGQVADWSVSPRK